MPTVDWSRLLLAMDKKYNLIVENKEQLIIQIIRVGYELLPWPVRVILPEEKWDNIIRGSGDKVWEAYLKLKGLHEQKRIDGEGVDQVPG